MDKKELKSRITSIDDLVTKLKQSKSFQITKHKTEGRYDLAKLSVNRKMNNIEQKMRGFVEDLICEIAVFRQANKIVRDSYCYALGHIYTKARYLGIELDPVYVPLIPKDSRYFTGKVSGRLSKLTDF